ncbi:hypothetical protein CHU98_g10179 [Xylaria longipes]|nr:hypothetical protein CHU98_g10179 [Xylaria longipes]
MESFPGTPLPGQAASASHYTLDIIALQVAVRTGSPLSLARMVERRGQVGAGGFAAVRRYGLACLLTWGKTVDFRWRTNGWWLGVTCKDGHR